MSSERSVIARNAGNHGILQMDILIFAFHSICYWDFVKITDV